MPPFDFDDVTVEDQLRRGTLKWSLYGPDVLALWVAEMDFHTAPAVLEALRSAVEREEVGYPFEGSDSGLPEAVAYWQRRRYGWEIDPDGVRTLPDVLRGVELALDVLTPSASPVVVPTPAYMPFFDVLASLRRPVVEVPNLNDGERRRLDLDGIAAAFEAGAGSIILCNPHNPLGRSYSAEELCGLCEVVDRYSARVVSDEIHAPLTYPGERHVPYASISPAAAGNSVTLVSASKGWNLPGLKCAQMILTNEADVRRWKSVPRVRSHGASTFGIRASLAAYRDGEEWLDQLVVYLDSNRRLLGDLLTELLPEVGYTVPQATYLAWLDFTAMNLEGEAADVIRREARVATNPGSPFRGDGPGHVRLNFATSKAILASAVNAISGALH